MPFTFSHPAIILPLTYFPRKWFSLTGLVIGSLTPDFEYFLRMRIRSDYSHTIDGLFWFDLPLGLLLTFIFHNIVRNDLFDNLPTFLKSRFSVFKLFDWNRYFNRNWLVVIISILIGAASHNFWDSFTHDHGYFVNIIPALTNSVDFFSKQVPILKILQHSSTLIGGLAIAFAIYKLPTRKMKKENVNLKYWTILIGLTLTIIAMRLLGGLELKQYGNVIVTAISAGLLSLILTPLKLNKRKTKTSYKN
ncbi:hypothetical protein P700755_000724 [Psychroflexus torquis ATCC 700755]|uniref:DUF4184 family protein n=1 Tax=Psychroflexus torquis (strain ATCC 700755 / CIP 106069 / ACAM 623) TaxID=313595 RepID=K4IBC3_PSYTT|nr:DUF4184 family protein [Psychroflexus torquis]AFU67729.1 hypothetical protein P700755_000724 [Psychroflexus torquis ATCC 700755]